MFDLDEIHHRVMPGAIHELLADDHARLDRLLERAAADPSRVAAADYGDFRRGLLRHIGMEEKILLPAIQRARGGEGLPVAARLRLDHGALAALLVPTPTAAIIAALRTVLAQHNRLEESAEGVYSTCERFLGDSTETVLVKLRAAPDVRVAPHVDGPRVLAAARRALARAGYTVKVDL